MDDFTGRQKSKWEKLAATWFQGAAPALPSREDLELYALALEDMPRGDVLILGCTPSLRDIAKRRSGRTFIADFSKSMLNASLHYLPADSSEALIQCDWTRLPLPSRSIAIVLGDKSIDNVDPGKWTNFFSELDRVVFSGGLVVLHVGLGVDVPEALSCDKIVSKWVLALLGGTSRDDAIAGLWEDLLTHSVQFGAGQTLSLSYWGSQLAMVSDSLPEVQQPAAKMLMDDVERLFGESKDHVWANVTHTNLNQATSETALSYDRAFTATDYEAAPNQPLILWRKT